MADLYQPANSDELKGQFLRDVRLAAVDAGLAEPPVNPGTDWDLLATAIANICILGFANVNACEEEDNLLTTTGQPLDDIRKAEGLPEVPAAGATGKLVITVSGTTTINNGLQFTYPSGLRGQVVQTYVNPADQSEVNVQAIDTGLATNLRAGEIVRFTSPPVNLATEAKVSTGEPLTGGTEEETDERKRARILNVRQNRPAGGNWAHIRQLALNALGTVQECYSYPAIGGPGSSKIVPVKDYDLENGDFSRALSSTALDVVRLEIQSNLPTPQENVVSAVANETADATIKVTIPDSTLSGGNGRGWTDAAVWPLLVAGDLGDVRITTVNANNDVITVDAGTAVAPIEGLTHIAWWSQVDRKFYQALVVLVGGVAGAWILNLDRPLVGKDGAGPITTVGSQDFISPAAEGLDKYGAAWVDIFREMGPGENTADASRLPRSKRHPFVTDEDPSSMTTSMLGKMAQKFPEIADIEYGIRFVNGVSGATSPTVPASVATAPNVLVPRRFGVYKL
jgi:Baseplate J-like protein